MINVVTLCREGEGKIMQVHKEAKDQSYYEG
jgi:hypothetical protein